MLSSYSRENCRERNSLDDDFLPRAIPSSVIYKKARKKAEERLEEVVKRVVNFLPFPTFPLDGNLYEILQIWLVCIFTLKMSF